MQCCRPRCIISVGALVSLTCPSPVCQPLAPRLLPPRVFVNMRDAGASF